MALHLQVFNLQLFLAYTLSQFDPLSISSQCGKGNHMGQSMCHFFIKILSHLQRTALLISNLQTASNFNLR